MTSVYIVLPIILAVIDVSVFVTWVGSDDPLASILPLIIGLNTLAFIVVGLTYLTLWCYDVPIPPLF